VTTPPGSTANVEASPWRRLQAASVSRFGMVSTQHHRATEVGVQILEAGGNAMDAAVASAFALGVCEPAASGLGGQTMMVLYDAASRRKVALDGSSRAPNRAVPRRLSPEQIRRGYAAATVPSTPAVLDYALRQHGSLPLERILEPVIELAERGYRVSQLQRRLTLRERKHLRHTSAGPLFLVDGRKTPPVGHVHTQPALANTLRRLAQRGIGDFYNGRIARAIHADMRDNGGLIRRDDLAQIPWPIERRPVRGRFGDLRVFTMPPPGAGRTLIEILSILARIPASLRDIETPRGAVVMAEVIRQAYIDRRDRPFDPNFYPQVDERHMLDPDYAARVARHIRKRIRSHGETTHLSVMDRHGNAVALTQSIERVYGACVATPELGFLYNNYMSAFDHTDMGHPYYLRPNAVPWASVAPAIIIRGRRPWLAIGSPGSERIAPSVAQVLLRILDGDSLYEAIEAPRMHCSLEGRVSLEAQRMEADIPPMLESFGFEISEREAYSFYLGCVQAVLYDGKRFRGVADPRRDGAAGGPRR
jgi:gamma-glutamyltranspeptidase/glutathione hydrolase